MASFYFVICVMPTECVLLMFVCQVLVLFSLFSLADCVLVCFFFCACCLFCFYFMCVPLFLVRTRDCLDQRWTFSLVRRVELRFVDVPAIFWQAVSPPGCLNDTEVLEVCIPFAYFIVDRIGYTNCCCSNWAAYTYTSLMKRFGNKLFEVPVHL